MSFFNKSLIFGYILFNYVPAFIFGCYLLSNLTNEHFDEENGVFNWQLARNSRNVGKSEEAREYIQELRTLDSTDSRVMGARLWVLTKNKEKEYTQLWEYGFSNDIKKNQSIVSNIWNYSGGKFAYQETQVVRDFATEVHDWMISNEKHFADFRTYLSPEPLTVEYFIKKKYPNIP